MEYLISYQNNLCKQVDNEWNRYLFPVLSSNNRLIGIKGLRGVGKTTMFLQFLQYVYPDKRHGIYVTADHPFFYSTSLFEMASDWHKFGGKLILIDEIHKHPNWAQQIKLMYDGFPDMKIMFTSSSALKLYQGEADLSRRLVSYTLHGLSFREFLAHNHEIRFDKINLRDVLFNHQELTVEILKKIKVLPLFRQYLQYGYFPFSTETEDHYMQQRLLQIMNTVLESDMLFVEDYSAANVEKMKRLLGIVARIAPFEPNISKLAEGLKIGRNTAIAFLKHLKDAGILNLVNKPGKGITLLQKPDKIYFENTSLMTAFQPDPNQGTVRETFFINQLTNAGHTMHLSPDRADFLIDETYTFEVGGKTKDNVQIRNIRNSFKVLDNIEYGFDKTIPLWLFGFLY